jgi:hypothetical protein
MKFPGQTQTNLIRSSSVEEEEKKNLLAVCSHTQMYRGNAAGMPTTRRIIIRESWDFCFVLFFFFSSFSLLKMWELKEKTKSSPLLLDCLVIMINNPLAPFHHRAAGRRAQEICLSTDTRKEKSQCVDGNKFVCCFLSLSISLFCCMRHPRAVYTPHHGRWWR